MVVGIRMRIFLPILLVFILIIPVLGQDEIDSGSGSVNVEPDISQDVISIPVDDETNAVDWQTYWALPPGVGANFGFVTALYQPDPAALADCPEILLDGAWYPVIPFSYGYSPADDQTVVTGWWYLEDTSSNLARRDMQITAGPDSWSCSTWFLGGSMVYHIEEGWTAGYYTEAYYPPDEWNGPGIDYFIRSVWFRGILGGERMQQLLTVCNAYRIGRDMIDGGRRRLAIFEIPANEIDRQNGRGSLLVWLTVGDWRLVRTRLHAAYAIEVTQFENVSPNVSNDPGIYDSDYLPADVYWSMDQYLLTHETPFFPTLSDTSYSSPEQVESENLVFNPDEQDSDTSSSDDSSESLEE